MNLTLVLAYSTVDGCDVEDVDAGISIHTGSGEALIVLYSSYTGTFMKATGPVGQLRCRLTRLPLNAGRYIVGARICVRGEEADWPRDGIAWLEVEPGDFYRTGSSGCTESTFLLVDGSWESRANAPLLV